MVFGLVNLEGRVLAVDSLGGDFCGQVGLDFAVFDLFDIQLLLFDVARGDGKLLKLLDRVLDAIPTIRNQMNPRQLIFIRHSGW
jgi:hypothetical protein